MVPPLMVMAPLLSVSAPPMQEPPLPAYVDVGGSGAIAVGTLQIVLAAEEQPVPGADKVDHRNGIAAFRPVDPEIPNGQVCTGCRVLDGQVGKLALLSAAGQLHRASDGDPDDARRIGRDGVFARLRQREDAVGKVGGFDDEVFRRNISAALPFEDRITAVDVSGIQAESVSKQRDHFGALELLRRFDRADRQRHGSGVGIARVQAFERIVVARRRIAASSVDVADDRVPVPGIARIDLADVVAVLDDGRMLREAGDAAVPAAAVVGDGTGVVAVGNEVVLAARILHAGQTGNAADAVLAALVAGNVSGIDALGDRAVAAPTDAAGGFGGINVGPVDALADHAVVAVLADDAARGIDAAGVDEHLDVGGDAAHGAAVISGRSADVVGAACDIGVSTSYAAADAEIPDGPLRTNVAEQAFIASGSVGDGKSGNGLPGSVKGSRERVRSVADRRPFLSAQIDIRAESHRLSLERISGIDACRHGLELSCRCHGIGRRFGIVRIVVRAEAAGFIRVDVFRSGNGNGPAGEVHGHVFKFEIDKVGGFAVYQPHAHRIGAGRRAFTDRKGQVAQDAVFDHVGLVVVVSGSSRAEVGLHADDGRRPVAVGRAHGTQGQDLFVKGEFQPYACKSRILADGHRQGYAGAGRRLRCSHADLRIRGPGQSGHVEDRGQEQDDQQQRKQLLADYCLGFQCFNSFCDGLANVLYKKHDA